MKSLFILYSCLNLVAIFQPTKSNVDNNIRSDCAPNITAHDQRKIAEHYRLLVSNFINASRSDSPNDPGMKPGSVIFINSQDRQIPLTCPCEGDSYSWRLYEYPSLATATEKEDSERPAGVKVNILETDYKKAYRESIEFAMANYNTAKIRPRTPSPRKYFRTYECQTKSSGGESLYHYFNIFTRPAPVTSPHVQWIEGGSVDSVTYKSLQFSCEMDNKRNTIYLQEPFTISWVLPNGRIVQGGENRSEVVVNDILKFAFRMDDGLWPASTVSVIPDHKSGRQEAQLTMAGIYECVITDKNGLSSSFGGQETIQKYKSGLIYNKTSEEGLCCQKPPLAAFKGFVHVHVREWWRVWVPVGFLLGGSALVGLMVKFLPSKSKKRKMD